MTTSTWPLAPLGAAPQHLASASTSSAGVPTTAWASEPRARADYQRILDTLLPSGGSAQQMSAPVD
ncbi:hypothetical protein [Streptomyces sp. NPDC018833]|uniref:hypothetical protein n=1 Tax=Streptomyces sp. NPDC018833 TaxID=3365053 RepID=UPI0037B84A4B